MSFSWNQINSRIQNSCISVVGLLHIVVGFAIDKKESKV